MSENISDLIIVFLHWLCFVSSEIHCWIFKMHGIDKHILLPMSNAVPYNISKSETEFTDLPSDSNLMSSSLTHVTPCCQVSWKLGWQVYAKLKAA